MCFSDLNDQAFREENIAIKEPIHLAQKWLEVATANPAITYAKAMCLCTATKYETNYM